MGQEFLHHLLTFSIFLLGLITVVLSIAVSIKFHTYKKILTGKPKNLSNAVGWQLAGEAVIGFGTLVFSAAAFFDVLQYWSIGVQSTIRFLMFFATSMTTIHLHRTLKNMRDNDDGPNSSV